MTVRVKFKKKKKKRITYKWVTVRPFTQIFGKRRRRRRKERETSEEVRLVVHAKRERERSEGTRHGVDVYGARWLADRLNLTPMGDKGQREGWEVRTWDVDFNFFVLGYITKSIVLVSPIYNIQPYLIQIFQVLHGSSWIEINRVGYGNYPNCSERVWILSKPDPYLFIK